ncbi:MAG: 1-deoxy-D-xylulose-5-phosphate synthase N-terminal domain-containing protein [Ilumatobacteraceae bacterium]
MNTQTDAPSIDTLRVIEQRVLWLATRIVDAANRRGDSDIKVGGHQASSASMVSIMTALWFAHLDPDDKVAVKPHASPVYHAIKYLTGELDARYLTTLRQRGGLQAYPSRTKDPDVSDFSTGSVGLGAVAPLFAAATARYLASRDDTMPAGRFIALVGDAELDEGNVWEAIADPALAGLGRFSMIVDLNRQSLDRVIPDIAANRLRQFFHVAGWHVVEVKYGRRLQTAFSEPDGDALRAHIDSMPNEAYQHLFTLRGGDVRVAFLTGADSAVERAVRDLDDDQLAALVTDLGGHDLQMLIDSYRACDAETERPSVVLAYTVKGRGLPFAGDPLNHSALLTPAQIDDLRTAMGLTGADEWARLDPASDAGRWCDTIGTRINNTPVPPRPRLDPPDQTRTPTATGVTSTQEALGRSLTALADHPEIGPRIVTTAPDVSISTSLGGWINKRGVYSPTTRDPYGGDRRLLKRTPEPSGQHIELGISEMNLFMLLGQLGLAHEHFERPLIPIGTVYDPFVLRGLDALVYSLYNGARFIIAGTPSGITLAPEGGAHQSTITAGVGLGLPQLHYAEPAYATELDWLLTDAIRQLGEPDGQSTYFRLTTRPIDQTPFGAALDRIGTDELRRQVLAGGYRLLDPAPDDRPAVTIVTTGATAPEALDAAAILDAEGITAAVVHLTSPTRIYRDWHRGVRGAYSTATGHRRDSHLHTLIGAEWRDRPVISVHDAASNTLAWIGSAVGARHYPLGVDQFGESGTIADLHEITGISAGHLVNAALIALHDDIG